MKDDKERDCVVACARYSVGGGRAVLFLLFSGFFLAGVGGT